MWYKAVIVAVIFWLVSMKAVYDLTNQYIGGTEDANGCPNNKGIIIHAVVAGVLFWVICWWMHGSMQQ